MRTERPSTSSARPARLVGKTLIARLLSEFLLLKNGAVRAFDINLKEPSLLDYLPKITETAEIDDTFGKMALMDRLIVNDGIAKVIDLGFHAFDEFFKMSEEIGFMKEAARRGVSPMILFVADTDRVSARAYPMLQQQIPATVLVTVDNEYRGARRAAPGLCPRPGTSHRRAAGLPEDLYRPVEHSCSPTICAARGILSTELHQWIRENYFSFRELELNLILQKS